LLQFINFILAKGVWWSLLSYFIILFISFLLRNKLILDTISNIKYELDQMLVILSLIPSTIFLYYAWYITGGIIWIILSLFVSAIIIYILYLMLLSLIKPLRVYFYTSKVKEGTARDQNKLGVFYLKGNKLFERDEYKAVLWFTLAAQQGYAPAQYNLAECYYNGKGVNKEIDKQHQYFRRATPDELGQAYIWYSKAAEQGHIVAQYNLARLYYSGEGVERDISEAIEWCFKAAEQGFVAAQYSLALCYFNGIGVEQDKNKAIFWQQKAKTPLKEENYNND